MEPGRNPRPDAEPVLAMKLPQPLLKIGLLLVAVALSWTILEAAIRHFRPEIGWMQRPDPLLGWSSHEFQEFDADAPKAPDTVRLLFLGDSFLAGSGVGSLESRFPCLIGDELGPGVEVGILASGGWGTDQELLGFMVKGAPWRPDLVVLAFCANNDISNNLSHHHGPGMWKPYFTLDDRSDLVLHDATGRAFPSVASAASHENWKRDPLWKHSRVLGYLAGAKAGVFGSHDFHPDRFPDVDPRYKQFMIGREKPAEIYRGQDPLSWAPQSGINHVSAYIRGDYPLNTYQWELFERILVRLRGEVEAARGRFAVMLLPVIFDPRDPDTIVGGAYAKTFDTPEGSFTFSSDEPRRRLQEICARNGIELFDPTGDFRREVRDGNLLTEVWPSKSDRHFSERGHRILARSTLGWLRNSGALDGAEPTAVAH